MKLSKYAFIEIERQKGASPLYVSNISEELMKKLLIDALPLGNPENEFSKTVRISDEIFLSSLLLADNLDYGLALIIQLDGELQKLNPICLIESMNSLIAKKIKNKDQVIPLELELEIKSHKNTIDTFENFDTFIFSVFSEQKTLIVGNKDELKTFLGSLFEYIPEDLRSLITFTTNTSNITNSANLQGIL
ncbi:MAG: hypothetical protein FK734_02100, partial [Asgard group archaeon]|nr:hypothetical protein [Asgard group archaeon]